MTDAVMDLLHATVRWQALFSRIDTPSPYARAFNQAFNRILEDRHLMVYWMPGGPQVIRKEDRPQ